MQYETACDLYLSQQCPHQGDNRVIAHGRLGELSRGDRLPSERDLFVPVGPRRTFERAVD